MDLELNDKLDVRAVWTEYDLFTAEERAIHRENIRRGFIEFLKDYGVSVEDLNDG